MDRSTDITGVNADVSQTHQPVANRGSSASRRLAHLHDLKDYKVADGEPDVRGWMVKTMEGVKIGKIVDLVVDQDAMKVCFLKVLLNRDTLDLKDDRNVLVPIETARLNDDEDLVIVNRTAGELINLPAYTQGFDSPDFDRPYDDRPFFGNRRRGREDVTYLVAIPDAIGDSELRGGRPTDHTSR
jgi:sporulation protein YlmC with PRC-barrel domain